jgi:RNA 2',3'-cyclic 3'-phosphodiesterase
MRLFFSVPLSADAKERAASAIAGMRRAAPQLSWTRTEQLHFTIAFLGEQPDDALERAASAATECRELRAFDLSLGGAGAFPNARRARVVWLGCSRGAAELEAVAAKLCAGLRAARFELQDRPFRAHLTIARVKPGSDRAAARALENAPTGEVTSFRVPAFHLVRSYPGSGGARHETLRTFPLIDLRSDVP